MKICWVCDSCNWLQVSDSKEHHQMDNCRCKKNPCGVDLEEHMCRFSGSGTQFPRIVARFKDNDKWRYVRR